MVYKENVLKTRSYEFNIQKDIEKIRKKYGIRLPKYFTLFCETFEFGEIRSEDYLDDYGNLIEIGCLGCLNSYRPYFGEFHGFLGNVNHYGEMLNLKIINENKLWVVAGGEMSWEHFIGVATKEPTQDKVVKINAFDNTIEECEDNIFDFLNGFHFGYYNGLTDFNNLIRFWGDEDYWKQKDKLHIEYNNSGRNHEPIPRTGFTFIGIRPKDQKDQLKLLLQEKSIPFRLNTFLTYFRFEGKNGLKSYLIYDEKQDSYIRFELVKFSPTRLAGKDLIINNFYTDVQLIKSLNQIKSSERKFLEIGKTDLGYKIQVGINGDLIEEVWLISETPLNNNGDLRIKLADDIFKFIRGLVPIYQEEYFNKIYRNWGEDFWRIKEK